MMFFLLLTATSLSAADSPAAEHLLYLADQGLAVIRLRIEVDGKSQRELCRDQVTALCQRADLDHDDFLTAEEFEQGIANHPAIQEVPARTVTRPGAKPDKPDFGAGRLAVNDAAAYVFRRIWPSLRVDYSSQQMSRINAAGVMQDRPIADTQLFERLDTDGNHELTGRELDRAASVLAKLDFDEDDVISLAELRMQSATAAPRAANSNPVSRRADYHLSALSPDRIDAAFVRTILERYDGKGKKTVKDLRLEPAEIRMAESLFTKSDADENGYWDFDELWRFLERPVASLEISLQFSTDSPAVTKTLSAADADSIRLIHEDPQSLQFDIYGTRFQLDLPNGVPNSSAEQLLKLQFQTLDGDKNEYLETGELIASGAEEAESKSSMFQQFDANGDEKINFAEFSAHYRKSLSLRDSQMSLAVENLGRTLFGPLDINGDGRLSQRELAQLKSRLPKWDVDGDGKLIEAEIPQQYRLTLTRGAEGPTGRNVAMTATTAATSPAGPLWFRKMDRNRDGEVSTKEFLGTKTQFEKIDANSDGAIDAEEAAAVK